MRTARQKQRETQADRRNRSQVPGIGKWALRHFKETLMPRSMLKGPARDIIYYTLFSGLATALTYLLYLYVNGLV